MPSINVKLCSECLQSLLTKNPYVNEYGDPIPYTGIKLRKVAPQLCDNRAGNSCNRNKVMLTAMRCGNCQKTFYIKVVDKQKPICPSCRSMHMIKMKPEEIM